MESKNNSLKERKMFQREENQEIIARPSKRMETEDLRG
jgi:hypothetical protein